MNRGQIVPIAVSTQQTEALTPSHIPLLTLLEKTRPVFCEGKPSFAHDDLADLVDVLFSDRLSDEAKATELLRFIVKLHALVKSLDVQELNKLEGLLILGQVKLFPLTLFFSNALSVFQTTCLPNSILTWNEGEAFERDDRQAHLNATTRRFELVRRDTASQPAKGGAR